MVTCGKVCQNTNSSIKCFSVSALGQEQATAGEETAMRAAGDTRRLLVLLRSPAAGLRGRSRACAPCWPSDSHSPPHLSLPQSADTHTQQTHIFFFKYIVQVDRTVSFLADIFVLINTSMIDSAISSSNSAFNSAANILTLTEDQTNRNRSNGIWQLSETSSSNFWVISWYPI